MPIVAKVAVVVKYNNSETCPGCGHLGMYSHNNETLRMWTGAL